MLENQIQSKIIKYLESIGSYLIKTIATNKRGVPDIIVCYKGYFIALEVKAKSGKATKLQLYHINKIRENGGIAEVVRSVEEVQEIIRRVDDIIYKQKRPKNLNSFDVS